MKHYIYLLLATLLAHSCSMYDDTWIKDKLDSQNEAVTTLESFYQDINSNVYALKSILASYQAKVFIKSVAEIVENGVVTGYQLTFSDGRVVKLHMGLDGADGADGADSHMPVISVRQNTDGVWYWTIDGQWCLDSSGKKVPTIGNDAVTPLFKIEEGYWYVSVDGGITWDEAGVADGIDGDLIFSDVDYDDLFVYLTMADGEVIKIPMVPKLGVKLGQLTSQVKPGSTFSVDYTVTGSAGIAELTCVGEHGWTAAISPATEVTGKITITSPASLVPGKIVIFVSEGEEMIMKALSFDGVREQNHFMISDYDFYEFDATGGYVDVTISTDQEYTVEISDEAQGWIKHIQFDSVHKNKVRLGISANSPAMPAREAKVTFKGTHTSVNVLICQKAAPYIESEVDMGLIDGFDNPEEGIVILQQATVGSGTDIVIMGDGFTERHFTAGGTYETLMKQAYEDFFSVEPYASLKEYFNVYYINVLSEEEHDAVPYYDSYGNQNGAIQGTADTKLGTSFVAGSTSVDGDTDLVLEYATQAIEMKGSASGGSCDYVDAYERAHEALVIVLANVDCYAGTCLLSWRNDAGEDYANLYSIAYCALGNDGTGRQCKYTLIHEAGGHGFGKLADEYSGSTLTQFSTSEWTKLNNYHSYGVYRNVNEYWTEEESLNWSSLTWDYTTEDNVYWAELLDESYGYVQSEGLGMYEGAYTYSSLFCRSSLNSLMRSQLSSNGQYFNAISRWAIWYRLMRLTDSIDADNFKASLADFIEFDSGLEIEKNQSLAFTASAGQFLPLGEPILVEYEWRGNSLVPVE